MLISRHAALTGGFADTLWKAMRRGLALQQPDTIRYYLEKWLVIWPAPERQALACLKTALLLESGGFHQQAADVLQEGLRREPDTPSLRSRLSSRLAFNRVQLGRPGGDALQAARAAVNLRPDQAEPWMHLGLSLEANGQDEMAAEAYLAGIQAPVLERELITRAREIFFEGSGCGDIPARQPAPLRLLIGIYQLARPSGTGRFTAADLQARLWITDRRWAQLYQPLLEALTFTLEDGEAPLELTLKHLVQQVQPGLYQLSGPGQLLKQEFFSQWPKPYRPGSFDGFLDPEGRMIFNSYLGAKGVYLKRLNFEIESHQMRGEPEKAEDLLRQLVPLADNPEEAAYRWLQQGVWRERAGDFESALDCYREGLDLRPGKADTRYYLHNNTGYCLNRLGRHAEAESWCRKAIAVEPDYHNAHKNLGLSLEGQGRWLEAAEAYRDAVRAWPADRRAFNHLERLLDDHPGLVLDFPTLEEFLRYARPVVKHARAISAFADPERKAPDLPVPLQLLVTAAQITRDTGRKTFSPGELKKRLKTNDPLWTVVYAPRIRKMSLSAKSEVNISENYYREIFALEGHSKIRLTTHGKAIAELGMKL